MGTSVDGFNLGGSTTWLIREDQNPGGTVIVHLGGCFQLTIIEKHMFQGGLKPPSGSKKNGFKRAEFKPTWASYRILPTKGMGFLRKNIGITHPWGTSPRSGVFPRDQCNWCVVRFLSLELVNFLVQAGVES